MQIWLKELLLYLIGCWRLLPSLWFCTSGYSYKIAWLARAASSRAFTVYFPQWKDGIHIYLDWHVEKFDFCFRFIVLSPSFSSRCLVWVVCLKTTFNVSGKFVNFFFGVACTTKFTIQVFYSPCSFFAAIVCNDSIATNLLLDDEEKQKLKQPFYAYIKPYR